mgnify:CR=1 FL=1
MALISTRNHGRLDYLVGLLLMTSPWIFDYASSDQYFIWIPFALGSFTLLYSLLTDYELSLAPVISIKMHLTLDILSGLFLAASPWLLHFDDVIYLPHLIIGAAEVIISILTVKSYDPNKVVAEDPNEALERSPYGEKDRENP